MGLISPGGENLLDFLELRQVLSTYEGTSGNRSGGLRKGQSPCELLGGLLGFLSLRYQDRKSTRLNSSHHASCTGASRDSSPVDAGA